ncbi:hypothetical protein C479_08383 [Halovivax asiaticus JCM 14624]|uniref:THIF-type NAD/FAD binding fold domain-containing protein n=1 Tax=Halovivax asiaticus JCM 14624 TaxID=1227490 RepID=M0BMF6_9EURY|nr:TOMM precursor leader peptide-binding protein [Halovivax asiaticus]ELZ10814.1 hypothetical protein C479_08383 [Halovivax asiaticus JCM 14624]
MTDDSNDTETIEQVREELERPVFNPQLVPVMLDDNTIHVRAGPWSGPIYTISDIDEDDDIGALFDLIDGETHIDEIFAAFEADQRSEVADVLYALADSNAIYDADAVDGPMYSHLVLKSRFRERERRRLEEQSILIVDDSRMGAHVAEDVLAMGVAAVGYAGLDGQQLPAAGSDDDRLTAVTEDELPGAVDDADFVAYLADGPSKTIRDVNEYAIETGTPWIVGQIRGFDGIVGPAMFPGETACYECFHRRMLSNVSNIGGYETFETEREDSDVATASLPMFSRTVAGHLSLDLLHLLAFGVGYTAGRVLTINSLNLAMEVNEVLKLPRCGACGRDPSPDVSRFITLDDMVLGSRQSAGDD